LSQTGKTKIVRLTRDNEEQILRQASSVLARDLLLIFPTDTVYGIGGAAFSPAVHDQLAELKGTREGKAYALLVSNLDIVQQIAGRALEGAALRLAQNFWPGALTIIWHAGPGVSSDYAAPDSSIGYRVPDHAFLRSLLAAAGGVIWATSANRPNATPPATFNAIESDVMERAALAIDGNETLPGVSSTVVDPRTRPARIVREGAISVKDIRTVLGEEIPA